MSKGGNIYCTVADMKNAVSELKTLIDGGKITEEQVTAWVVKSDTLIDSYCASRYKVPFVSVPPVIKTLSIELTTFFYFRDQAQSENEREKIWARVRDLLEGIRSGEQKLIDANGDPVAMDTTQADTPSSNRMNVNPVFNMKDAVDQSLTPSDYD